MSDRDRRNTSDKLVNDTDLIREEDVERFTEKLMKLLEELRAEDSVAIIGLSNLAFSALVVASFDVPMILDGVAERLIDELGDEAFKAFGVKPRVEGSGDGGWILIDFGEVLVNLFLPEQREYYSIERLWQLEMLRRKREMIDDAGEGS